MQIHTLRATFGRLQDDVLSLSPGLNVIYAPNESGKTTWSRFLCCMLYGLNTRDRSPGADKNRYFPWNGSAMRGTMGFSADGGEYTMTRDTRRSTMPMGEFLCVDQRTGDIVPGVTGSRAGEHFLGIPREVFERSAFIGQNALAVDQDVELEKRIASLITTGEEDISYTESRERLRRQSNRRRYHKIGSIPVLEEDIRRQQGKLAQMRDMAEEAAALEAEIAKCRQRRTALLEQQALWQQIDAQERCRQATQRRRSAEVKLRDLYDRAVAAKTQLQAHPLCNTDEAALDQRLHPQPLKKPLGLWLPLTLTLIALGAGAACYLLSFPLWSALSGAGVALLCAVLTLVQSRRRARYFQAFRARADQAAALQRQIDEYRLLEQNALNAIDAVKQYRQLYESLPLPEPVSPAEFSVPTLSPGQVAAELTETDTRLTSLRSRLDTLAGQMQSLGSRTQAEAELAALQERLSDLQTEYDAIAMAMDSLEQANSVLQSRFSPALGNRAAEIFRQLTAGRYEKVLLRRDFSLLAEARDEPVMHAVQSLSQGAADQLYLAVRLAICDMVLPENKAVPLVLDDALLSFDDDRLRSALDYLVQESQKRQILLFTCQHREQEYLQGRPGVTVLSL